MLLALLALVSTPSAQAQDDTIVFSHDDGSAYEYFGTGRRETYDVAMRLGEIFAGKQVTAITVPIKSATGLSDLKVWLSKELTVVSKKFTPDIVSKDGELADGSVTVTLDEPYTVPDSGLYVGYTVQVSELTDDTKKPIAVNQRGREGGCIVHSSRTYVNFADQSAAYNSVMGVTIAGVQPYAVMPTLGKTFYTTTGTATDIQLMLTNTGRKAVESVDYTYEIGNETGKGHADVSLAAEYGLTAAVTVQLPAQQSKGVYPVRLTVDRVNGETNAAGTPSADASLYCYNTVPVHRPAFEEYSGTWCGSCPRGLVGMEIMSQRHPDDFVAIAYHNNDPMMVVNPEDYPNSIGGHPYGWLNRSVFADPYYGFERVNMGIEEAWQTVRAMPAPADITVKGVFDTDNRMLTVSADVTFPLALPDESYRVEFVVVEDDMYDINNTGKTAWMQSNYYVGRTDVTEPEFEKYVTGSDYVSGVHYDDVFLASSRLLGTDQTLPADIVAEQPVTVSTTFDATTFKSLYTDEPIVQDVNKLRVVALLVDANTGLIVNSNKAKVEGENINAIASLAQTADRPAFFDLQGRRLPSLQPGVNIVRMPDGSTKKVIGKQ